MEADTIHAATDKTKKNITARIDIPKHWANLILFVHRNPPLTIKELEQKHFLTFSKLLTTIYIIRKKNTSGEPTLWLQIKWLQYCANLSGTGIVF